MASNVTPIRPAVAAIDVPDYDQALADQAISDIGIWFNGFGFGVFAGTLAIAVGATLWAWLS